MRLKTGVVSHMFQCMANETDSAVLEILTKIQVDMSDMKQRLDSVERIVKAHRRDSAGMMVLMRAAAGDFEERMTHVEAEIAAL
jgi:uncharacterized membrane-anchored protein YhcB (DUF1043 family)